MAAFSSVQTNKRRILTPVPILNCDQRLKWLEYFELTSCRIPISPMRLYFAHFIWVLFKLTNGLKKYARVSVGQLIFYFVTRHYYYYWSFSLKSFCVSCVCFEFEIELRKAHFYNKTAQHYSWRISFVSCDSRYLENSMIKSTFKRNMWILSFGIWAKLTAILPLGDNTIGFCMISSKRSTSKNGKTTEYAWSHKTWIPFWFIYSNKWK